MKYQVVPLTLAVLAHLKLCAAVPAGNEGSGAPVQDAARAGFRVVQVQLLPSARSPSEPRVEFHDNVPIPKGGDSITALAADAGRDSTNGNNSDVSSDSDSD
ncbi:hypothetical protein EV182_002602 [Spiromyces aspiralis]|uniref:Uncharacterized protein n=1 Tax=Spiromyces aspiralis TaxID=68401 RepID=A0ACC1HZ72_9FUNG|nr:hypothetical protein EV182_002602 [Spiromyces aspiralis]